MNSFAGVETPGHLRSKFQRHPISMRCHFEHSLVIAWALPNAVLAPLVPPGLVLDTYDDSWGFVAVAAVQTRSLRPVGLPECLGRDYALTGYRIFVRHTDRHGRTRRGLHILRSDTDKWTMKFGGNALTHYRYRHADIEITPASGSLVVTVDSPRGDADLGVVADLDDRPAGLPASSPFRSELDARRFAGPLPWTFDYEPHTESIVMIHGRRSNWRPRPTHVDVRQCTFLEQAPFAAVEPRLANAFHVTSVDYEWERGVRVAAVEEAA